MDNQNKKSAQGLASLGRGPDTELVHMTPNEVQGLQTLARGMGGGLTVNPNTGLPEAGFLSNILPAIIGAGLFVGTGGAINPLTAGMLMGGGALAASGGDLGQAAKYGLGGAGGASLAGSLGAAGAGAGTAAGGAGTAGGAATTSMFGGAGAAGGAGASLYTPAAFSGIGAGAGAGAGTGIAGAGASLYSPAALSSAKTFVPTFADVGRGIASPDVLKTLAGNKLGLAATVGGMAAGYEPPKPSESPVTVDKEYYPIGGYKTNKVAQTVAPPQRDARGNIVPDMQEQTYFSPNQGGITQVDPNARNYYGPEGTQPNYYGTGPFGIPLNTTYAAQGGLMGFANGGLTAGPGDGMSDDIPAVIGGEQPAALSPGEFVVPADVVSDMGNGSSRAGARQLYSMMDRVRKARGGSVEQPEAINPNEYMPA